MSAAAVSQGRVLLLDPTGTELATLGRALEQHGYETVHSAVPEELGSVFWATRPDTAVIDLGGGAAAARVHSALSELRGEPTFQNTPLVVLGADGAAGWALPLTQWVSRSIGEADLLSLVRVNVEVKQSLDQGERRAERLASLLEVSRTVNSTLDSGAILYIIARKLSETMELVRCSFIVPELANGVGRVIACKDDPNIHSLEINLGNYPEIIQVLRTGRVVIIEDVEQDPLMASIRKFADVFKDQSIMTLPLQFHDETIGVLQIRKKGQRRGFTDREVEYCELLANAAANALKNAQLYEDIEKHNEELRNQKRELEQLSSQLKEKNEELIELQRLKEEFSTMLVHDLRSPMMVVQGVLDLLNRGMPASEGHRLIEDGIAVTRRILGLINKLLEVARIESGELRLQEEAIDAGELLEEAVKPYRAIARSRSIELTAHRAREVGSLHVDGRCLIQILDNLLSNAFKFTPDGGRVAVTVEAGPDRTALLEVSDTGAGIVAEDVPHIFKRFRQGRGLGRKKGTGLGLAIVDRLVELHTGSVAVESTPGQGSRFLVRLPGRLGEPSGSS